MTNPVAAADGMFHGQIDSGFDLAGFVIPVEHQYRDKILDPFGRSLGLAKTLQKSLHGRRPALAPLPNGSCTVEGHRSLLNQIEVVVGIEAPLVVAVHPLMDGQLLRPDEDLYTIHGKQNLHRKTRIPARSGIAVLIHDDRGVLVHPTS
jgi:hypothetical protein